MNIQIYLRISVMQMGMDNRQFYIDNNWTEKVFLKDFKRKRMYKYLQCIKVATKDKTYIIVVMEYIITFENK